jgi:hypothetical protein
MPNPKIVIVLTRSGIESVTVAASKPLSRTVGYEICKTIEGEINKFENAVRTKLEFLDDEREKVN